MQDFLIELTAVIAERLLAISGEDFLTIDRKIGTNYGQAIHSADDTYERVAQTG